VALKPRAHQNGKFGILAACVIVQAHHAQHPLALVVDGNEGHGAGRIVVDELVEQFVAHFAKRREEAQPNASGNDSWLVAQGDRAASANILQRSHCHAAQILGEFLGAHSAPERL
jgi:hypothetical protein